jgi:hypothetical protein
MNEQEGEVKNESAAPEITIEGEDQNMDELMLAIESLNFGHIPKFSSLDLSSLIAPLAKNYELLIPIAEGSIKLFYSGNQDKAPEAFRLQNLGKLLLTMLQCGTKPFDAIMWIGVRLAGKEDTFERYFQFSRGETCSNENQVRSISIIAANWLLFITRGTFPLQQIAGRRNPLPRFIQSMLHPYSINSEWQLLNNTSSFDLKHVKSDNLLKEADFNGWDEIIVNRMHLGVAGHKTMKLAVELSGMYKDGWKTSSPSLLAMVTLGQKLESGFYPTLHPSTKIVADKFPKFYFNTLRMIFDNLRGTPTQKYEVLVNIPYLKNDSMLINKTLDKLPTTWTTWNTDELTATIGPVVSFSSKNRSTDEDGLANMVEFDGAELPKSALSAIVLSKDPETPVKDDSVKDKVSSFVIETDIEEDKSIEKDVNLDSKQVPVASIVELKSGSSEVASFVMDK